jgi:glycosyltransferase involved in cell wall biosynthesis
MPRRIDLQYELLGMMYPPRGPLPTYVCCSQYVADSFESSRYLRRFPRQVVPNGVKLPPESFYATRAIAPGRPPVIGMVARLNSIKDQATLVRAMAIVRKQFADAELELVGDGDERRALERLVGDLGLGAAVRFAGDVADVYRRMTEWDLFAYATTEREGLGNAVAEAMMFGLPCIVTDVGPMREFVGAGDAVRLVKAADPAAMATAICDLIVDVDARAALSASGQRHAMACFHPAEFARRYAEILGLGADVTNL